MNKHKIIFIVNNYLPKIGGVELHTHFLVNELSKIGHDVTVVTLGRPANQRFDGEVKVITLKKGLGFGNVFSLPSLNAIFKLSKLLREEKFEFISTQTRFFPMSWLGAFFANKLKIKHIHTEHGSGCVENSTFVVNKASKLVDKSLGVYTIRSADEILAVSENVQSFVKELSNRDAVIFYNAITSKRTINPNLPSPSKRTQFVFVGRLVPGKGADLFVRALQEIDKSDHFSALIIGEGPQRAEIERLIREFDLSKSVKLTGKLTSDKIYEFLHGSVYVNPTVLKEGFQTTLLESIDAGASVATFQVPGAEILFNEKMPIFIAKERSINSLVTSMKKAAGWQKQSQKAVLGTNWFWDQRGVEFSEIMSKLKN